ncbi:MAG: hypothetical protein WDZ69_00135 [Candidatus Pacearchaeota archaeon]
MKNENNLEEKTRHKEYSFRDIFIPFSHMSFYKNVSSIKQKAYSGMNIGISYALFLGGAIYLGGIVGNGSLNPYKWSEIQEQREIQREAEIQNFRREKFFELDLNNNGVIDSTEYVYRDSEFYSGEKSK